MVVAGIVLAGGRSRRMGADKSALAWGDATLLARAVDLLRASVDGPVLVAHARSQALPVLADPVERVSDRPGADGPLNALATALTAVRDRSDVAVACAVDTPFLTPELMRGLCAALTGDVDLVTAEADGVASPLPLAVRVGRTEDVLRLVDAGARAIRDLEGICVTRRVPASPAELRNLNTPADYRDAGTATPPGLSGSTP